MFRFHLRTSSIRQVAGEDSEQIMHYTHRMHSVYTVHITHAIYEYIIIVIQYTLYTIHNTHCRIFIHTAQYIICPTQCIHSPQSAIYEYE